MTVRVAITPPRSSDSRPLRLGVSRCLLGDQVRFDGGHKRDVFLSEALARFVEWVPVCPELEVGMGVPRESVRLVGRPESPHMRTVATDIDHTQAMSEFSRRRVRELEALNLCGYVFKKDSPSCGMERVRVFDRRGTPSRHGVGLFARAFMEHFPLIPVEEEGRLNDPVLRENFIERIFAYRRWRDLIQNRVTRRGIVAFHTIHKYQLLSHNRPRYQELGRLVAGAGRDTPLELAERYGPVFMEALKTKATVRKNVNVLQHLVGHFTDQLSVGERAELVDVIEEYHQTLVPLVVPIMLVRHHVNRLGIRYLQDQVYLNPHPKELMLRNRV